MKTPGVYSISCEFGKVYIGQTGCSIEIRINEHRRHIRLYHPEKSAMAEHSVKLCHCIQFHDTNILAKRSRHMEHFIREVIVFELHPNNIRARKDSP
jgi:predicted GIY-YIG superfamily endonuclease